MLKSLPIWDDDRRQLLEIIGELLSGIVPRYKALAESGQVELSVTPYAHPIMPLLLDVSSAREAMPVGIYGKGLRSLNSILALHLMAVGPLKGVSVMRQS